MAQNGIDAFIGTFKARGGVARDNRFAVNFAGLKTLQGGGGKINIYEGVRDPEQLTRDMTVLCQECNMPGRKLSTFGWAPNYGVLTEMPTSYSNDPLSMTFILTGDYQIRQVFTNWISQIVNPSNWKVKYPFDYKCDLEIAALTTDDRVSFIHSITDAYPTNVQGTVYTALGTEALRLNVEFVYNDWSGKATDPVSLNSLSFGATNTLDLGQTFGSQLNDLEAASLSNDPFLAEQVSNYAQIQDEFRR